MRVLLLVHGLDVGGAESMIASLARHLAARGDVVEVGCLGVLGQLGDELREQGMRVIVHARRPGFDATLPWRLAQRVRGERFEVVHVHQRTALFYGVLAGLLHAAPIVYSEHGPAFAPRPGTKQRAFNRLFARRLSRITAVSRDLAHALRATEGFTGREIAVVHNGVDHERWAAARNGHAARVHLGLPIRAPVLGTVGRLEAVKNQALLVRVVARLRRRLPDALLVLVGDGAERDRLAALARELGVADGVRFLGLRRDVERILPAFDVFCLSSWSEGIPIGLLEAMAARVAVVATAAGGVPEAVCHERDGLLVASPPPHDGPRHGGDVSRVEDFAAAVERLLLDPALRHRLSANACVRVQAEFAIDTACSRYREILAAPR